MSASIKFENGDTWSYRGKRLRFERYLGNQILYFLEEQTLAPFQVEDDDGRLSAPDMNWAITALALGELKRLRDMGGRPPRSQAVNPQIDPAQAARLDQNARLRAFVVRGLDKLGHLPKSDKHYRIALAKLWAQHPQDAARFRAKPSPRTARRWMYERGTPGDRLIKDMVSMSGRVRRRPRLCLEVKAHIREAALWFWSGLRWSKKDAYARLATTIHKINAERARSGTPELPIPSREILRREILKTECFETIREKFGVKVANNRFKACGVGLRATRILQIGAMDHTLLDGVAVFDGERMLPLGRPWLTAIVDVYSGCLVGMVLTFEPPSIYSVMECIKRANRPKIRLPEIADEFPDLRDIFGRFDEIVVDNGKEFAGVSLQDGLADLGISLRLSPVGSPTYKAVVERIFNTLNTLVTHKLPGGVLPPDALREFGYDPRKDAVLTLTELEELLWDAISLHHVQPRAGEGPCPVQLWKESAQQHQIAVIGDDTQLEKMLGAVVECTVSRSGVELHGLYYHDEAEVSALLEELIGYEPIKKRPKGSARVRVKVKYNPACISEIHVWNRRRGEYVTLPCVDEKYPAGISLWHHKRLQEAAKAEGEAYASEADRLRFRAAMIQKLEDLAPTLKGKERRAFARLSHSPKVQSLADGEVALAYAPARHDGLAPVLEHDLLAPHRSDEGKRPSRPPPTKKKGPPKAKRAKQLGGRNTPKPHTGHVADFSVNLSAWKEIDL